MGGIFISYRREDSAPYARLLSDSLGAHFGAEQIFRDIDTIGPGADFPQAIATAVGSCKVLLAVIGDKWLTAQQDGRRRLDNEGDYVRLEIAAALERDVLVVPVLLEQTRMPGKAELPPNLAELADRNAIRLTDDGWHDGVRRLAAALEQPLGLEGGGPPAATPPRTPAWEPGTSAPSSWTQTPLPQPATRRITRSTGDGGTGGGGTGDGRTGGKRTGLIVGAVVAVVALIAIGVALAGGGDGGGGDEQVDTETTATSVTQGSGGTSVTLGTVPRPTVGRVTIDPNILAVETDVDISPASGPPGTTVTVSGTGFTANERIDLRFHTTSVGDTRADAKGAFAGFTFRVPSTPFRGEQFDVVATGATSIRSARSAFRVT